MVRLLLVTAVRFYRDSLARHLAAVPNFAVAGTAEDAESAIVLAQATVPDLVLADAQMPGAVDAIRVIRTLVRGAKILAIGVAETEREIIRYVEAGALGYVPVHATLDELVANVHAVARGEVRCSPRIAASLCKRLAMQADHGAPRDELVPLTAREREIARLLEQGRSNKEIAHLLGIEIGTVKHHVHNLLAKLQARRRGEAVARLRNGMPADGISRAG